MNAGTYWAVAARKECGSYSRVFKVRSLREAKEQALKTCNQRAMDSDAYPNGSCGIIASGLKGFGKRCLDSSAWEPSVAKAIDRSRYGSCYAIASFKGCESTHFTFNATSVATALTGLLATCNADAERRFNVSNYCDVVTASCAICTNQTSWIPAYSAAVTAVRSIADSYGPQVAFFTVASAKDCSSSAYGVGKTVAEADATALTRCEANLTAGACGIVERGSNKYASCYNNNCVSVGIPAIPWAKGNDWIYPPEVPSWSLTADYSYWPLIQQRTALPRQHLIPFNLVLDEDISQCVTVDSAQAGARLRRALCSSRSVDLARRQTFNMFSHGK